MPFKHNNMPTEIIAGVGPNCLFQYNSPSLKLWPNTKKQKRTIGGISIPGLFATDSETSTVLLFVAVLILEAIGMILLWESGFQNKIYITVAVVFDIGFALMHHSFTNLIKIYKTNELLFKINGIAIPPDLKRKIISLPKELLRYTGLIGIIFIALAKFYIYFDSTVERPIIIIIILIIIYASIALLHIFNTGYFIQYLIFSRRRKVNLDKFHSGDSNNIAILDKFHSGDSNNIASNTKDFLFTCKENIPFTPYAFAGNQEKIHCISKLEYNQENNLLIENINGNNREIQIPNYEFEKALTSGSIAYNFKYNGNLLDEHIELMAKVNPKIILSVGLQIQLESIANRHFVKNNF